ncbi:SprT-like domain-containing protein [Undibacterium sp. TJN25]|uniref:SprT-like domain-containing protein n=1 Tax=Undibacterium sp. TJN25 TaxID=3413056 RepID=UPI003BF35121
MSNSATKPTDEFYGRLQAAYDYFNLALFDNALPHCLITVQREKNTMGFFSAARWSNNGKRDVHEIALNPAYFARRKVIEVFQTLVHEQCHVWQHEFGNPSRTGYHNREWSEKMESIGLMPSATGAPGGDKLGQKMSDYPIEGGRFRQACVQLMTSGYQFNWIDRRIARHQGGYEAPPAASQMAEAPASATASLAITSAEAILDLPMTQLAPDAAYQLILPADTKVRAKTKYYCPGCETNVWGKPQLSIRCEDCDLTFISV